MIQNMMMSRRFMPLFLCQFFAALNDNFVKAALVFLILCSADITQAPAMVSAATARWCALSAPASAGRRGRADKRGRNTRLGFRVPRRGRGTRRGAAAAACKHGPRRRGPARGIARAPPILGPERMAEILTGYL